EVLLRFPPERPKPILDRLTDRRAGGETIEVGTYLAMIELVKLNLAVAVVRHQSGEVDAAIQSGEVVYKAFPELGQAEIAAYFPPGGKEAASNVARQVYNVIEEHFLNLASHPQHERKKERGKAKRGQA